MLHLMSFRSAPQTDDRGPTAVRALFGVALLIILFGAGPAFAQGPQSITLAAPMLSADPGDTVDVGVDLTSLIGVSELATIKFAVRVDTSLVEPIDARPGDGLSGWPSDDFSYTVDGNRLGVSALTDPAVAVQTGSFVFFRFRVRDEVVDGFQTPLNITATSDEQAIVLLTDPSQSPPGVKTVDVDGSLTVTNGFTCLAGDSDGDGSLTTADAILALRLVMGLLLDPSIETLCGADANGDQQYNAFDATWILRDVVGLPLERALASGGVPQVELRRSGDGVQLRIESSERVLAAEVRLSAEDGATWQSASGPAGALSLSDVQDHRLTLGLARVRAEDDVLVFELDAGQRGRIVLEHLRLFDADGAVLAFEMDGGTLQLSPAAGPSRSFLSLASYPNPFNPSTTLHLDLPRGGHARLEVFDVSGRHVTTLVDRELPAGSSEVVWHGQDARGQAVSSGVYFARLVHGGEQARQRLLLVK